MSDYIMAPNTPPRLSKDLAARILDRAASIDATVEKVDVATLRAAALDAGISPEAFERALWEAATPIRERTSVPERPPATAYEIASATLWVGAATGALAILIASAILGPDDDALAGAVIGGGGALVGVFVHLLRKFRSRNR